MPLTGADYKLLETFVAVVETKGVSNAQSLLGKDSSTISRALAQLESRLGIHLCERGRQGFKLTQEGVDVYRSALDLLSSFRRMEDKIESIKGGCEGKLKIAMIDNVVSDPNCPLTQVLNRFSQNKVDSKNLQISLRVLSPEHMEQQLIEKRIDLAMGIFDTHKSNLHYKFLYQEVDSLYCSTKNPIAKLTREVDIREALLEQRFVTRTFLDDSELRVLGIRVSEDFVHTENIEAMAQLILADLCIGFIPRHYASQFVEQGLLRPILERRVSRFSNMEIAYLAESSAIRQATAQLVDCFEQHTQLHLSVQKTQA